ASGPGARPGRGATGGAATAAAPLRRRPLVPGARTGPRNLGQHGQEPARPGQGDSPAGAGELTMDLDLMLREFFTAAVPPRDALARLRRGLGARPRRLEPLADRFRIEASDRGVTRLQPGRGVGAPSHRARRHSWAPRRPESSAGAAARTSSVSPTRIAWSSPRSLTRGASAIVRAASAGRHASRDRPRGEETGDDGPRLAPGARDHAAARRRPTAPRRAVPALRLAHPLQPPRLGRVPAGARTRPP